MGLNAMEPKYLDNVTLWQEVTVPAKSDRGAYMVWDYSANYSNLEWSVHSKNGVIHAQLDTEKTPDQPIFKPTAEYSDNSWICTFPTASKPPVQLNADQPGFKMYCAATSFAEVDDGWLVGFNKGEWGGALYWFSHDGTNGYKISDDQIVAFFSLPDGVYAIIGLAHLVMSEGSIIRITRQKFDTHWQATTFVKLPFAPYAVALRRDGTMLITLSNSLVSVGSDRKIQTLLAEVPWHGLYPNSSQLAPDEQKLYIGMRQFVGEFDLSTNRFRFLIPSKAFLNKLPKENEERIRKQYGG